MAVTAKSPYKLAVFNVKIPATIDSQLMYKAPMTIPKIEYTNMIVDQCTAVSFRLKIKLVARPHVARKTRTIPPTYAVVSTGRFEDPDSLLRTMAIIPKKATGIATYSNLLILSFRKIVDKILVQNTFVCIKIA
jgi:hypothetical protein